MEAVQFEFDKRTTTGKGLARKARMEGRVPGILYGHKSEPLMFYADGHKFSLLLQKSEFGRNQLLAVRGLGRDVEALVKDIQFHPVTRTILHCDLVEVWKEDRVTVVVPVRFHGKAKGQSAGGTVQLLCRKVKLLCTPHNIPSEISLDITPLDLEDDITVATLPLPEGAEAIGDPKVVVLVIKPPRVSGKKGAEEEGKK
ncbi:MAG: 50S ribosomal protein L25 [Myxococcales bacterium]|nr:50S ribosomal protein L25 [Myxococcales bacterium]